MCDDLLDERGFERGFGREFRDDGPLAAFEQVHRTMFFGEALGRPGEEFAVVQFEKLAEFFIVEQLAEFAVMVEQEGANGKELFALGHIHAGGDDEFGRGEVEEEAAPGGFFKAVAGPPGGDLVFVGGLVVREAGVAVDPHHALRRGADVIGGEGGHGVGDGLDDHEHGSFKGGLEERLARVEPVAAVVALQGAKEFQRVLSEVGLGLRRCWFGCGFLQRCFASRH